MKLTRVKDYESAERQQGAGTSTLYSETGQFVAKVPNAYAAMFHAAPDMYNALQDMIDALSYIQKSYAYTHVVRGQCPGQPRVTANDMSMAQEYAYLAQQARERAELAIRKARGEQ